MPTPNGLGTPHRRAHLARVLGVTCRTRVGVQSRSRRTDHTNSLNTVRTSTDRHAQTRKWNPRIRQRGEECARRAEKTLSSAEASHLSKLLFSKQRPPERRGKMQGFDISHLISVMADPTSSTALPPPDETPQDPPKHADPADALTAMTEQKKASPRPGEAPKDAPSAASPGPEEPVAPSHCGILPAAYCPTSARRPRQRYRRWRGDSVFSNIPSSTASLWESIKQYSNIHRRTFHRSVASRSPGNTALLGQLLLGVHQSWQS